MQPDLGTNSMLANLEKDTVFLTAAKLGEIFCTEDGRVFRPDREMMQWKARTGYHVVAPTFYKKRYAFLVHRLIWIFFNGPILDNRAQINHINGDKSCNQLSNLELVDHSQNMLHAYAMGLNKANIKYAGHRNANAKLTEQQVREIRELRDTINPATGKRFRQHHVAEKFSVSRPLISMIWNRKTHTL